MHSQKANLIHPGGSRQGLCRLVRIAHSSVQDYLQSFELKLELMKFGLESSLSNWEAAFTFLIYLYSNAFGRRNLKDEQLDQYPLAQYAAEFWPTHFCLSGWACEDEDSPAKGPNLDEEAMKIFIKMQLLDDRQLADFKELRQYTAGPTLSLRSNWLPLENGGLRDVVYFVALLGVAFILPQLDLSQAMMETYATAMQIAAFAGQKKIVKFLKDKFVDINMSSAKYGDALQAASRTGQEGVFEYLLENGANVFARDCGPLGSALVAACASGNDHIVTRLLEEGVDVNMHGNGFCTPLIAAIQWGHSNLARRLIRTHKANIT